MGLPRHKWLNQTILCNSINCGQYSLEIFSHNFHSIFSAVFYLVIIQITFLEKHWDCGNCDSIDTEYNLFSQNLFSCNFLSWYTSAVRGTIFVLEDHAVASQCLLLKIKQTFFSLRETLAKQNNQFLFFFRYWLQLYSPIG